MNTHLKVLVISGIRSTIASSAPARVLGRGSVQSGVSVAVPVRRQYGRTSTACQRNAKVDPLAAWPRGGHFSRAVDTAACDTRRYLNQAVQVYGAWSPAGAPPVQARQKSEPIGTRGVLS
jgi:hypothetical protein